MKKTYDPEVDALLEQLLAPRDAQVNYNGYIKVVDADVAERAAKMIFDMYERLSSFEAEEYNRQIGG